MSRENLLSDELFFGFTQRLKIARKEMGFDLEEFGKKLGVSGATVSRYESGDIKLSRGRLRQYVDITKKSQDWFLSGKDRAETIQQSAGPLISARLKTPPQANDAVPRLDEHLLHDIILLTEECLEERQKRLSPSKKAGLYLHLYRRYQETAIPVSKATIFSYLDLLD